MGCIRFLGGSGKRHVGSLHRANLFELTLAEQATYIFVVRDDAGTSDILFQTSDTTWQAYNSYGGNSLYVGEPVGRAYKVSYNRPLDQFAVDYSYGSFSAEYPMIRWLEANGYNVSYTTGVDTDRRRQPADKSQSISFGRP